MAKEIDLREPVFFQPNRVWRCYTGGVLLDRFLGRTDPDVEPGDGHFPEEWIASTTLALNGPHQQSEDEGLSRVRLPDGSDGPLLLDLVMEKPEEALGPGTSAIQVREEGIGVLSKFLDSAVRLPIQCHPDRAFAREHYGSEHGKTEAWIVLGAREIEGEAPYLLMGFTAGTRREAFAEAVREQDIPAMESMLHRIPARPGEAYIIPGRFPHAIGPGVFLLEVQEPTDWVVQPERFIGAVGSTTLSPSRGAVGSTTLSPPRGAVGSTTLSPPRGETELSDTDMWGPLTPEVGLECFDYGGAGTLEEVMEKVIVRTRPRTEATPESGGAELSLLIGPDVTDCFRVERLTVEGPPGVNGWHPPLDPVGAPFHVAIVTAGRGEVRTLSRGPRDGEPLPVKQGDTFFVSNRVESLHYRSAGGEGEAPLTVYLVSKGRAG